MPGHGRGVDDIVGIDEKGNERTDKAGSQHDFAIQVAEAGIAALAIEPMGFGCRRIRSTPARGLAARPAILWRGALLVGQTMIGWRVWDIMRTVDYIAAVRAQSEPHGLYGISGGGTVTVFSTLSAAHPGSAGQRLSEYVPRQHRPPRSLQRQIRTGILNWAEMLDLAGLIAPPPLFVESGEKDNIFPIQASIENFNEMQKIYGVFGARDLAEQEVFPDEHAFWGKRGIPFLARQRRREHRFDVDDRCAVDRFDGTDGCRFLTILPYGTRCRPMGFGRSGERVANTPVRGRRRSDRG